jgi:hypothetical protein
MLTKLTPTEGLVLVVFQARFLFSSLSFQTDKSNFCHYIFQLKIKKCGFTSKLANSDYYTIETTYNRYS